MAVRTSYFTWNPVLHFQLLRGGPAEFDDELRRRTVRFTLVDRARAFDTIEWDLDNTDGMLIRPEYLALGVIVRVRLGYANCEAPWRTFLINRVKGDPGVYGEKDAATGHSTNVHHNKTHVSAQITYSGRNRNAKAPKSGKSTSKKKGTRYFGSTTDVSGQDFAILASSTGPRIFPGRTTSECVRNIAAALGFFEHLQLIQDTHDTRDDLRIPETMPDGVFLRKLAQDKGFIFKIDADGFHFHHPLWNAGKGKEVVRQYIVGGQDVLKISIDGDFRLPVPSKITAVGRNVVLRHGNKSEATAVQGDVVVQGFPVPVTAGQQKNLQREYVVPVSDAGRMATDKATRNFINARLNSYKVVVDIVGDPLVMASNQVELAGTGSPLVDGVWYVDEVKHQFSGQGAATYVSTLTLRQPAKSTPPANAVVLQHGNKNQPAAVVGDLAMKVSAEIVRGWERMLRTAGSR